MYALLFFPDLVESMAIAADVLPWKHLQDIEVPEGSGPKVDLLMGQDVPHALIPLETRLGGSQEPYAVRTQLGWIVSGPMNVSGTEGAVSNLVNAIPGPDISLKAQVEQFCHWIRNRVYQRISHKCQFVTSRS